MPQVKGVAFRTVMEALEDLFGAVVRAQALEELPEHLRKAYIYKALLPGTWYPIEDYVALWVAVQAATGNRPDTPRQIGRLCVRRDVGGVHRFIMSFLSRETVVALSARIFKLYYDTGTVRTELLGERHVRVTFSGCQGFSAHMWNEVVGSTEMFTEVGSRLSARARLTSGGGDGDPGAVVEVTWS